MNAMSTAPVVGLNVPAVVGMDVADVGTPALIIDLDAFERNVKKMRDFVESRGIRHRAHAKTHKSADLAEADGAVRGRNALAVGSFALVVVGPTRHPDRTAIGQNPQCTNTLGAEERLDDVAVAHAGIGCEHHARRP